MTMWWEDCDAVHCGFWMNWSQARIYGATITVPNQWGLIIIGFVAIIIKLTLENVWRTISFAAHQLNSSSRPRNDVYHQVQLLLRNMENQFSFMVKLGSIWFAHQGTRSRSLYRFWFLFILAAVYVLGSFLASGFLPNLISDEDNLVLTIPRNCGWYREPRLGGLTDTNAIEDLGALVVTATNGIQRSAMYGRNCYGAPKSNSETACRRFIRHSIPYNSARGLDCPFGDNICSDTGIAFEAGNIRSDLDLGINSKAEDSIIVQKSLTCAPLAVEEYSSGWIEAGNLSDYPGDRLNVYYYGHNPRILGYPIPNISLFITESVWLSGGGKYQIFPLSYMPSTSRPDQASTFEPIPALASNDSDLTLVALQNAMSYREPVVDPWFSADNCSVVESDIITSNLCVPKNPITFLGCRERYKVCTYGKSHCSPLTALYPLEPTEEHDLTSNIRHQLPLNPRQKAIYALVWKILWSAQLNFAMLFSSGGNLVAKDYFWGEGLGWGVSATLPPKQWEIEVQNWMNISLATMQRSAVQFARPSEFNLNHTSSTLKHILPPQDKEMQNLCKRILAKSPPHTSFSVLRLSIVVGFCILSTILKFGLPNLVARIQLHFDWSLHKRLEWNESNYFQLQRIAAEGMEIGPWKGVDQDVPVLKDAETVFTLVSGLQNNEYQAVKRGE